MGQIKIQLDLLTRAGVSIKLSANVEVVTMDGVEYVRKIGGADSYWTAYANTLEGRRHCMEETAIAQWGGTISDGAQEDLIDLLDAYVASTKCPADF